MRDALADGTGPLTAEELFKEIPTLDTMYKAATHTVIDRDVERICFVSTMGYLSERLQEEKAGRRGLTQEFYKRELGFPPPEHAALRPNDLRPRPDQTHQPWYREMEKWHGITERLEQDRQPDAQKQKASKALAGLLSDFVADGGFGRLHRVLQEHLKRHGQENKEDRLQANLRLLKERVEELDVEVKKLDEQRPAEPTDRPDPDPSMAEAVHSLSRAYQTYVAHAEAETRRYPLVRYPRGTSEAAKAARAARAEPILPPLPAPLIAATSSRWDEWRLLLARTGRTAAGLVELVDREDPALKHREADLRDERRTPVKSDDFMKPFLASLAKMQKALRERCLEGLKHHSEELRRDLEGRLGGASSAPGCNYRKRMRRATAA